MVVEEMNISLFKSRYERIVYAVRNRRGQIVGTTYENTPEAARAAAMDWLQMERIRKACARRDRGQDFGF